VSLIATIRSSLGKARAALMRRLGLLQTDWESSLPEEVRFWANALSDPSTHWIPEEFSQRTDPSLPLQQELQDLLGQDCGPTVRILDVGAGPLTRLGKVWVGKTIEIVATDPLATEYDRILSEVGLKPLVRTIAVQGEMIAEHFSAGSFDLAYASNSLDHAKNPVEVIRQMGKVIKDGGHLYLWHFVNCGIGERYQGLHQWNFSGSTNDLFIDDGRTKTSLRSALGPDYELASRSDYAFGSEVVVTTVRKIG
jgi:SAM-dependent methyltransferase